MHILTLPTDLLAAIETALATVPAARWLNEAQALSARYRGDRAAPGPLVSGHPAALGYAALILPATYAQLHGAMRATAARAPHWQPRSVLDLGSGPGTALWAALAQWPSLQTLAAWEREPAFIALGQALARTATAAPLRAIAWQRVDLAAAAQAVAQSAPYDLVILGHVLNELAPAAQAAVVDLAWRLTSGVLLIVEPGTSAAFPLVRAARDQVLGQAAHTLAPCVHDLPCPLRDEWCHFPQRLHRPAFQRRARNAPSEWEDSKFSYAALARFAPAAPLWGRVINEPTSNKAYAEAMISTTAQVARYRGWKRYKARFRQVKDLTWGTALPDALPADLEIVPVS